MIAERLSALNSEITIKPHAAKITQSNCTQLIKDYDVILDATDNYTARYIINAACREHNIPLVSASIFQFDLQISVFNYRDGPCYQCLFPEPPPSNLVPNCATGGVLGVLPGVAGTLQATEALKIILDIGNNLSGSLLTVNLLTMDLKTFDVTKTNCDLHPTPKTQTNEAQAMTITHITPIELDQLINNNKPLQLIDVREDYEREISHIGGTHIPLATLEQHLDTLDKGALTIVYCKAGGRSLQACQLLENQGFTQVINLKGGMLDWAATINPDLLVC